MIGPWPIRPVFISLLLMFVSMLIASGTVVQSREGVAKVIVLAVAPAVTSAAALLLVLWMYRTFGLGQGHLVVYLALLFAAAIAYFVVRTLVEAALGVAPQGPWLFIAGALRSWAWIVVFSAIVGVLMQRIGREAALAQQALQRQREQEQLLLLSEERARERIATLLHDRVQAGIIGVALELRLAMDAESGIKPEDVLDAIARLEELRDLEVRNAAHALSPDLANVDFRTAIEVLSRPYRPGMSVRVNVDASVSSAMIDPDALLCAYRITEQALLNAAAHGHARECAVTVTRTSMPGLELLVVDDGDGLTPGFEPGLGLSVVDTWCRAMGGEWSLADTAIGTRLHAVIPITS